MKRERKRVREVDNRNTTGSLSVYLNANGLKAGVSLAPNARLPNLYLTLILTHSRDLQPTLTSGHKKRFLLMERNGFTASEFQ